MSQDHKTNPEDKEGQRQRFLTEVGQVGTITAGAKAAGVSRRTAKRWIDNDPAFRERYEEALTEFRESLAERLMEQAQRGNGATLRFIAKAEWPEKYDAGAGRRREEPEQSPDARWEELERAAEDD